MKLLWSSGHWRLMIWPLVNCKMNIFSRKPSKDVFWPANMFYYNVSLFRCSICILSQYKWLHCHLNKKQINFTHVRKPISLNSQLRYQREIDFILSNSILLITGGHDRFFVQYMVCLWLLNFNICQSLLVFPLYTYTNAV